MPSFEMELDKKFNKLKPQSAIALIVKIALPCRYLTTNTKIF